MSCQKLLSDMRKADEMFNLINDGDYIGVGLSGGKDSSLLMYMLKMYQYLFNNVYGGNFKIIGIHINLNFGEDDMSDLWKWFDENELEYYSEDSEIADILGYHLKNDRIDCSLCSKLKKGAVIKAAKKLGCNKVAFGHHADDALETMMMNMIYGGRIATFDPKMYLDDSGITFIRPFSMSFESDISKTAKELQIPVVSSGCPNDGYTKRADMKEMLHHVYHNYPGSKENLLKSIYNKEQLNLYMDKIEKKPNHHD
ncbi:MAG: ATP-binding protein [Erysipelotrichaceae bacterium]|nr:ATP-binding protein [Erysipelotrichaceae bacterium]